MTSLPPVTTDEAAVGRVDLPPLARPDGGPIDTAVDLAAAQSAWRAYFADLMYGPVPPPPDALTVTRRPLADEPGCERLTLEIAVGPRRLAVDAALWLPHAEGPVPLVAGLSFLGPAGVLFGQSFPIDADAVVEADPVIGLRDRRLTAPARGVHAARWPLPLFRSIGYGLLLSCYGSWVPDCDRRWRSRGLWPLLGLADGLQRPGAISLWAWAVSRLVDAAVRLPEVDAGRIAVAGHSRLGKAALWATANDNRIDAAIVNNAGCAGPALSRRTYGETLTHLVSAFPHWMTPRLVNLAADPTMLPVDQHQLIACVAPRRVAVGSAADDSWADPRGEYLGLHAAAPAWGRVAVSPLPPADAIWNDPARLAAEGVDIAAGALAWHLRPGGHGLTPWDWRRYLGFLAGRP